MKRIIGFSVISLAVATSAQAVQLNNDALKSMQQEGHKIVAESQGARPYVASNGQCLDFKGNGLVLAKCNDKSNSQKWKMDDKKRLVAHNGRCIGGAQLQDCGNSKGQKWTHDASHRLINQAKKCLQPQGNPPKNGAAVTAANCGKSAHQVWK